MGTALHLRHMHDAAAGDRHLVRRRRALARSYESVLREAHQSRVPLTARVPVRRDAVLAAEDDLERLAARLRDRDLPADPEGVRLANELLSEGTGPLYVWAEPFTLRRRVRVILEALG